MLETFRLPGESQQIERIMELFAATYFATKPADVASQDAAFILGYAVVMLNTDQHNRGVRDRMSLEQFAKNLRGVNNNENFSMKYLVCVLSGCFLQAVNILLINVVPIDTLSTGRDFRCHS